jgi:hypothetical protein
MINRSRQNRKNKINEDKADENEQTKANIVMPTPMFPNEINDDYEQKANEKSNSFDDPSVGFIQSRTSSKKSSFRNSKQEIDTPVSVSQFTFGNPNLSKKTRQFEVRPKNSNTSSNARKPAQVNNNHISNELDNDEQSHHLLSEDPSFATLRRNSYTKAIFLHDDI